jgi:hypothetical protein
VQAVAQALIGFYTGPDFKTIMNDTTVAIEGVQQTKKELISVVKDLTKSIDRQGDLEEKLNHAKDMIDKKIREILYP